MEGRRSLLAFRVEPPPVGWGILATIVVVVAGTLLVYPLKSIAPAVSLGVVYIPGVLLISTVWGWRLGLFSAVASAFAFNFFHIPPTGRLAIAPDRDGVALVVFVIVAVASSALAEVARARAAEAERRREETDGVLAELTAISDERDRMQAEAIEAGALRRSDELKTALLRSVSHDLRTPLTAMIAAGAALDSPSVTPRERHELSEAVVEEGQRLSRLVENLLDVSRLESGGAEPHREPVDLVAVLRGGDSIDRRGRESGEALARRGAAPAPRRRRPARARLRQPVRERRPSRRRSPGAGPVPPDRGSARGARGRPGPGHPGARARADLRALLPSQGRIRSRRRPRPGDRQGIRRGQRRGDRGSSRSPDRAAPS